MTAGIRMKWLFALAGVALLSACAVLEQQVKQPEVSVGEVRLVNMSLIDAELAFDLDVKNPNAFGIAMRGLSYSLAIDGRSLFDGALAESLRISGNGESRVTLPFVFRYEDVLGTLLELRDHEALRYQLRGDIDLGLLTVPYSKSGSFSLPQLPEVSVQNLRVQRFSLTGVELGVDLRVRNLNSFPLRFSGLDYQLNLAQSALLTGQSSQPFSVEADGSGIMRLTLGVDVATLGAVAQRLRSGDSLPVGFSSEIRVPGLEGDASLPFSWQGTVPLLR